MKHSDKPHYRVSENTAPLVGKFDRSPLMTVNEVASYLCCSIRHVYNLERKKYIRAFRHGNKMVRYHRDSVESYINEWSTGPQARAA